MIHHRRNLDSFSKAQLDAMQRAFVRWKSEQR